MARLVTTPNIDRQDDIYARLIALHEGLTDEESAVVNARLILLLINHVGDVEAVEEAIALAGSSVATTERR